MMAAIRRFSKSRAGQLLVAAAAVVYLRLIGLSLRWRIERPPATEAILAERKPFIACFWHGRLATMRAAWPHDPAEFHMLISGHSDGALVARAIRWLGFGTVLGSSRRGGATALRGLQQRLAAGACIGITPDGPRGPRMRAKLGAIKAAQLAGVPIVPVSGSATRCRFLKTWDRFCLVRLFGRGVLLFGEPILVPRQAGRAELEALRLELERRLNALTAEADRRCRQPTIAPAPLPAAGTAGGSGKVGHAGA